MQPSLFNYILSEFQIDIFTFWDDKIISYQDCKNSVKSPVHWVP